MMRAKGIIDFLTENDLITRPIDYQTAMEITLDQSFLSLLSTKFRAIEEFESMKFASISMDYFPVYFPDAAKWVLRVLAYNRALSPSTFILDEVQVKVRDYLQHSQAVEKTMAITIPSVEIERRTKPFGR